MKHILAFALRWFLLALAYLVVFSFAFGIGFALLGVQVVPAEPPSNSIAAILPLVVVAVLNSLVIALMIVRSRWHGPQLAAAVAFVHYGVLTFMTQIEAAVFPAVASRLGDGMLPALFVAGALLAVPLAPLAVLIMGKWRRVAEPFGANHRLDMAGADWTWKLVLLAMLYVGLYFSFGYYVAWRNPVVAEFYGGKDPGSFVAQLVSVAQSTPWMFLFQFARGLLWVLLALPIVRMSRGGALETGVIVGLQFAVLMCSSLLLSNPAMPEPVRMVHLVETAPSNFIFGLLTAFVLLWREKPAPLFSRPAPILR